VNFILTGFSGCGKSTVGRELANIMKMSLIDTDILIERKLCLSISDIFACYGQRFFRFTEREVIKELLFENNRIISIGGGAFVDPLNIKNLKSIGIVFFLNASIDTIMKNAEVSSRPLLKGENKEMIRTLYESRIPYYKQADYEIIVDGKTPNDIANQIILFL